MGPLGPRAQALFRRIHFQKKYFLKKNKMFLIFGPEKATLGPRDASGWLGDDILLRIGGTGPQKDGLRCQEGT